MFIRLINDWLRYAKDWKNCLNCKKKCRWCYTRPFLKNKYDEQHIRHYVDEILAPYEKIWSEAMLHASIAFLHQELGIHKIYYHTADSGAKLKSIGGRRPPRSLYTQLPKQFCFRTTRQHPEFLLHDDFFRWRLRRKKELNVQWHYLNLENSHAK